MEEKLQFAVLIDSDNVSSKYVSTIFDELDKYGYASCRRIYGNWSKGNGWTEGVLLEYSIMPIQQFSYTTGKNSTDMAMVIDAMDLLYKDKVDGFCIVTSDSDFTRLAMRLREEHKYVLGMGESKTPAALTRACNKFIHLNLIAEQNKELEKLTDKSSVQENAAETANSGVVESDLGDAALMDNVTSIQNVEQSILTFLNDAGNGPMELAAIGSRLNEKFSDFDVRNYGYSKLSVFIKAEMSSLKVEKRENHSYVRKATELNRDVLEREIVDFITANGGLVDNLSTLNDEIKSRHTNFDLKDYGFSRFSSYLRSIKGVTVEANTVRLKTAGARQHLSSDISEEEAETIAIHGMPVKLLDTTAPASQRPAGKSRSGKRNGSRKKKINNADI